MKIGRNDPWWRGSGKRIWGALRSDLQGGFSLMHPWSGWTARPGRRAGAGGQPPLINVAGELEIIVGIVKRPPG